MKTLKYPYQRVDMTLRVSLDLHQLIHQASSELSVSAQDVILSSVLQQLDSSKVCCPDWQVLPHQLS